MHDLVIRNGLHVDGTGSPAIRGDLAIDGDRITAVGHVPTPGRREIDAEGQIVAPGWVDVHTHYDGQVTWDPYLSPSSWNGVTTVVMGNCGVGFAPVRPNERQFLIELMEGVEDIPEAALNEGMTWDWESFPEYLDSVERFDRVIDVAAQVPHCALRAYVLGERAHDDHVSGDEIEQMRRLTREALEAGAVGFSTSRTLLHTSVHGLVPGTHSSPEELLGIGAALGEAGHGVFEMLTDDMGDDPDLAWMRNFCETTGRAVTFTMVQRPQLPDAWRNTLKEMRALNDKGLEIRPQVGCRSPGVLFGLQSSITPFIAHPSWAALAGLPLQGRLAELRKPETRAKILSEKSLLPDPVALGLLQDWDSIFPLGNPPDYEPSLESCAGAVARREGKAPEAVIYDWMLEDEGRALLFRPLGNYVAGDLEAVREMMEDPSTVIGLSDGGAHVGLICDASMPTYLLTYWVRDRTRGSRLPLESVIKMQTADTADLYGFDDRGRLAPGFKADVNIIDLDRLQIHAPEQIHDLPAGGARLVQRVEGYRATICSGEMIFENGKPTGAMPGRLIRGPQPRPA